MSFSIVLFDDCPSRDRLLPLVATRPVGNLRVGIFTLNQKWESAFNVPVSFLTTSYLRSKFPMETDAKELLYIKASILPSEELIEEIRQLEVGEKLVLDSGDWIAIRLQSNIDLTSASLISARIRSCSTTIQQLRYPEDIYIQNASQIGFDLKYIKIEPASDSDFGYQNILKEQPIFIAPTATVQHCVLDASKGPIYIGPGAMLEAGVIVHGPAAICSNSRLKSGAVLYGNVTIGNDSTISGEVNNVVVWGSSAKGHHGYLGCAVIGEGCNLGAGTTNSNLRNDWKNVQLYNYETQQMRDTHQLKCGVIMGDHVMLGINSKINTGTVIGVGAQVAISDFIPKFVIDFSWLTDSSHDRYIFTRFIDMMKRKAGAKNESFKADDELILASIYKESTTYTINQH